MQKQTISIPFATGQKDKTGDAWVDAGASTSVTNGIFLQSNTISKRPGIKALGSGEISTNAPWTWASSVTTAKRLGSYKNNLLLFDGQYVRARVNQLDAWDAKDEVSPVVATREPISQLSYKICDPDVAQGGGFRVFVWTNAVNTSVGTSLYYAVIEVSTGATVNSGFVGNTSASYQKPKLAVLPFTNVLVLVAQRASDNAITARTMSLSGTPSWSAETVLIAGAATKANVAFDAVYVTGSSTFCLAYENNAGVIQLRTYNGSLTLQNSGACTDPNTTYFAISLRADATNSGVVWLAFSYGFGNYKMAVHSLPTLAQVTAPFVVSAAGPVGNQNIGVEQLDATHAVILFGTASAGTSNKFLWGVFSISGAATIALKTAYHQCLLSRPILVNSLDSVYGVRAYAMVCFQDSVSECTNFLVELDVRNDSASSGLAASHPVATLSPRFSAVTSDALRSSSSLANGTILGSPSSTSCVMPCTVAQSFNGNGVVSLWAATFDWNHAGNFQTVELGDEVYSSGGVPSSFCGSRWSEVGFLTPTFLTASSVVAGGSLASSLTYSYIVVPEWRDKVGNRIFGQPSQIISATTTVGNKTIQLTWSQVNLTTKFTLQSGANLDPPYFSVYRTVATGGVMGTTFHKVTDEVATAPGILPSAETWIFNDDGTGIKADSVAASSELLYTTGGVLESDNPSSFTTVCVHQNRVFGVGDDQRTIWYSTESIPGQTVRFNDALTLTCNEAGPIVAIASMEQNLIVFKSDAIFYFTGSGPNELGDQNSFNGPFRIPTNIGCTGPRGWLLTPSGIVFRHRGGLALLDRGLTVHQDFGDPVESLLGSTGVQLNAANIHPSRNEMWFEVPATTSSAETSGYALVYNYQFDAWTVQRRYDSVSAIASANMVGAAAVNGTYYTITPGGHLFSEYPLLPATTSGQYKDGGTGAANWVTLSIETPWIKPSLIEGAAKTNGYGRANKVLGLEKWSEIHDVSLAVAYDYDTTYVDTFPFASSYHTSSTQTLEELEIRLSRPKCEAFRIKWSDAPPTGGGTANVGNGGAPTGLSAEISIYPGTNRIASSRRKG